MIFIERYPLKRCQGCVKLIASFLNINDLSEVQLCMSSNSWTWECPHTKDGADHVPLIFLSSVYCSTAVHQIPEIISSLGSSHFRVSNFKNLKWVFLLKTRCSPPLAANYTNQYSSMMKQFQALLPKYRALVYNGDADSMCNFLGDQKFVASLNRPILDDRRTWIYNNQVAGFVKEYEQVTFMTVKNSGHMVPTDTPGPALQMITNFLKNKPQ